MEPLTRHPHAAATTNAPTADLTRRDVLHLAMGLGLSWLAPALEGRAAEARGPERPRSLIMLWMAGGPSQLETWDPHPGTKIGGPTQAIKTRLPGLEIAHHFPRVAECIHDLCVLRSLVSKEGDHERGTYLLKTGYRPDPTIIHPSLGSILAHELPVAGVEIPRHVSILETQWPARGGFLGDEYDAFKVLDPNQPLQNLVAQTGSDSRQQRRLINLDVIDKAFTRDRLIQSQATLHRDTIDRALKMMSSSQLKAFKFAEETKATRAAYGETPFGRGCLVARRLIETGVRTVEVNLSGFDSHAKNFDAHTTNAAILDPRIAALIADLKERHLFESTVILCIGEFGRTPKINKLDGRDHHPRGFSALVGGGGFRNGVVIGATDTEISEPAKDPADPIEVQDLYATILHTLGVKQNKEMETPIGRPMALSAGKPIERLLASRT